MNLQPTIRVLGVTAFTAAAAAFVQIYTRAAYLRFLWEHHRQQIEMNGAVFLNHHSGVGYLLPALVGTVGVFLTLSL